MRNYLVFDAGGTFIKYALMDENAQILEKDKVSTPYFEDHGKEDFYRVLGKVVEKYREQIRGRPGIWRIWRERMWLRSFPSGSAFLL